MREKERVRPKIFLKPTLITALICLGVLIIIALFTAIVRQSERKDLQYKQVFFLTLQDYKQGLFLARQDKETEAKDEAFADGRYLRQLYAQNADLKNFWHKEWQYRTIMNEADDSDERKAYQEVILKRDKDAAEIFKLLEHSGWLGLSQEERNLIPLILAGEATAPIISAEGPLFPGRWFWIVGIILSQLACFLAYLIYWDECERSDAPWYRLPWGVPAVTIVFLLLQPGALIIMVPYVVIKILATDFVARFKQRKMRKESAPKTPSGSNFDKTTADAQALAERLRSRLKGGNNG
ncbi:MAG: hypothetical protein UX53_C0018G0002 [Candidatus Azambacteria bacterium GW2011_GWB2_46_37]|uniref:Uncharacterized protein n=4 Tax=Candidatus Azamiibacteriota TaxID=1752741 RepID=A0A0G1SCG9_9BACT|nr:MAG: hypothetical protein UX33_C0008G0014 [Candidatus Azambacteria bacterium GW2011_GWC1_46_13]KKU34698.1 MAG: hypothetical protein UX48_C0027G0006 [Candidatus Azambacteria bacterium GW2011_GWB1_46_27]KKU38981.1 MAG: hypothetical protein UX53_C0018G0002 [Candidatus Azambacteria bacterium GW2011_GWB2_46_37]KKU39788.1 MAG: hypothetical protein UX55_C0028G0008 [Candidatus Azambacteria bacterium GW2011_GWE2_46_45]